MEKNEREYKKISRRHKPNTRSKQSGVTLLIALLILSTVTAISFSLATILLAESRNSGDLTRTEPALYTANAVSEQALFNVKRNTGVSSYVTSLGNTTASSQPTYLNDAVQTVKVDTGSTSFFNTPNVYALYDPANPYGAGNYGHIQVVFINTGVSTDTRLNVYLCQWDPLHPPQNPDGSYQNVCSSPSANSYMAIQNFQLKPGDTMDTATCGCMNTSWNSSYQQELFIYQTPGTTVSNVYAQITTYDSSGFAKGIPYFGKVAVVTAAKDAGVSRNIKTVIPTGSSVSNGPGTTPFTTSVASYASARNNYDGWVGMGFTVGPSPITVTALGRMMVAGNSGTHTVKIVQVSNGTDIASVSINMSGGAPNSFVYQSLGTPVVLSAGASYYLLSQEVGGGDQWYDAGTSVVNTGVATENLGVYGTGSPYNSFSISNGGYVPLNFGYQ